MVEVIVDKRGSPQFGGQEEQCMIRKKLQRQNEVAVVDGGGLDLSKKREKYKQEWCLLLVVLSLFYSRKSKVGGGIVLMVMAMGMSWLTHTHIDTNIEREIKGFWKRKDGGIWYLWCGEIQFFK